MTAPAAVLDPPATQPTASPPLLQGLTGVEVDRYETRLEELTLAALREVMRLITRGLGEVTTAAADPASISPDDLAGILPLWQREVDDRLLPVVGEIYRNSANQLETNLIEAAGNIPPLSSAAAETYLAQARNSFSQVGNELWEQARSQLLDGMAAGESVPQLAARLRTAAPDLTNRSASLVARTQVNDAANAGSFDTARVSGLDLLKGWESTADLRTRETHLMAGSTYSGIGMIGLDDTFMVGGWPCLRPHDLSLPPEERYSCRCALVYQMRGERPTDRDAFLAELDMLHQQRLALLEERHRRRLAAIDAAYQAKVAKLSPELAAQPLEGYATRMAKYRADHEVRVATMDAEHLRRKSLLELEYQRRRATVTGELPPPTLPSAPPPTPPPTPATFGLAPTEVPVRAALQQAATIPEVRRVFIAEWQKVVKANPGAIRGAVRIPPDADLQTAREHAEGLLRAIERYPFVRLDVDFTPTSTAWAETVGHRIDFDQVFLRSRSAYLRSIREAGEPDATGVAYHPMSISSPQGIATHEFGHAVQYALARDAQGYSYNVFREISRDAIRIAEDLAKERGVKGDWRYIARVGIGDYASKNPQELIAEAFADALINGDRASELSKRILAMLEREYARIRVMPPPAGGQLGLPGLPTKAAPKTPVPTYAAVEGDGLQLLELVSLRSLAVEFEIPNAGKLTKARLLAELRARGAVAPQTRRIGAVIRARPGGTIGEVELGPTQLEQALGEAPIVKPPVGDFTDRDYYAAILARGEALPPDFESKLAAIRRGEFQLRPGLTADESRALDRYALSRVADPLNKGLRRGDTSGFGTARIADQVVDLNEELAQLDSAISAGSLADDTVLYRGALMRPADIGRLQLGAITSEGGFLSTTTDSLNAYSIINWRKQGAPAGLSRVVFKILARKGTPAGAGHIEEKEVLLARGQRFRVVDITKPTRPGQARLVTLEIWDEELRRLNQLGGAIGEALDLLAAGKTREQILKLLAGYPGGEDALATVRATTQLTQLADALGKLAYRRGITTLPSKAQVKVIKAARLKAAREAALVARAEKARQLAIKKQVKAIEGGDFKTLTHTAGDQYTAPDGSTWLVQQFATEAEARKHVLFVALRDLAEGRTATLPVVGRGTPGLKGWQVAYRGATQAPPTPDDEDWLRVGLGKLEKLTPAKIRALVAKVGLEPHVAERLVAERADKIALERLVARAMPSRRAPLLTDLQALAAEANPARFVDGKYGALGLRAKVTHFTVNPTGGTWGSPVEFRGTIFYQGRKVGTFKRDYQYDANGDLYAHHAYLKLDPQVRGSGFAEAFNANLVDWYKRSGIKEVRLSANIDVGGYAWAAARYEFANQSAADTIITRLEGRVAQLQYNRILSSAGKDVYLSPDEADMQVREAQALLARARAHPRFDDPLHPSAYEFSQVGRHTGQGKDDLWIGKAAMLGSYWSAVLYL